MNKAILITLLGLFLNLATLNETYAGEIKIGASAIPHAEILEYVKPILKEQGVELTIVTFQELVEPSFATEAGYLDGNYIMHRPFFERFVSDHGISLVEMCGVHIEPMAIYSKTLSDIVNLKDGSVVAMPDDPTNSCRSLLFLAMIGEITLKDPKNLNCTFEDIVSNPKNLTFKTVETPQVVTSLDTSDIAIINTNYALEAGLVPIRDAIVIEKQSSPYVNILVASPESAQKDEMKLLAKELNSPRTKHFIEHHYQGSILPAF